MKAQNRHDTKKWKKKRKEHHGDRCKNSKCLICHSDKVHKITKFRDQKLQNSLDYESED